MPIVIDRNTGEVLSSQKLTPEQSDAAWEAIVRAYLKKHPDVLKEREETK